MSEDKKLRMMFVVKVLLSFQILFAASCWSFQAPWRSALHQNYWECNCDNGGLQMARQENCEEIGRRRAFERTFAVVAGSGLVSWNSQRLPASAAATDPPTKAELQRIKTGYDGLRYLLDNWDKETTVCRENGGECKRDADAVRKFLGLRSTTDPLFQIEKVFAKVKYMDDVDLDKLDDFFEATEEWNTAQNMSNSMAFISQFGEYNPGGGQDEVLKYLNESKKQVVLAEGALKRIIESLDL